MTTAMCSQAFANRRTSPLRRTMAYGGKHLADYSVTEVCELVHSLSLDPQQFKENAVEGSDLIELTDKELEEYLNLKPLQIKKIRKAIADLLAEDGEAEPRISVMAAYKNAVQLAGQPAPSPTTSSGAFGDASGNGFSSTKNGDFGSNGRADARFASSNDGGARAGGDSRPPPPLKPAERAFARTVNATDGQDLAARDEEVEKELFGQVNTGINFDLYESIPAEATGNNVPIPFTSFAQAKFHPQLMQNIKNAGYTTPTPVQKHGFAIAMAERDMMACAQTGSGKTAAFLFPMISHLLTRGRSATDEMRESGSRFPMIMPEALIIAPTRELAAQIFDEARKFTYRTWVRPAVAYGGTQSIRALDDMQREGCHLMVATPGRLNDFIERRKVSLRKVKYLVLDEADRMLDMGFEPQIRRIVEQADLPKTRQTLLFSATFPPEIQRLAGEFMNDYVFLTIGRVGSTSTNIKQNIEYVEEDDKHAKLLELCKLSQGLTLIFVQTKIEANSLELYLTQQSFSAVAIHGDREQWQREQALEEFRTGVHPFLVATDVAARGLDIPNVTHVINFDMPATIDDYIHRIGRTGRVGKIGVATSFFNNQDTNLAGDLVTVLKEVQQPPPSWLESCAMEQPGGRSRYKLMDSRRPGGGRGSGGYGGGDRGGYGGGYGGGGNENTGGGGDEAW